MPPAPGVGPQVNIGAAFSWAIEKFKTNAGVMIAFAAVVFVLQIIRFALDQVTQPTVTTYENCERLNGQAYLDCIQSTNVTSVAAIGGFAILSIIISIVFTILSVLAYIGLINASLKIVKGETPTFGDFWNPKHGWMYVGVVLIFAISTGIGILLCLLPGLFVIWVWQFAQYSVLDDGKGVFAALGDSYQVVMANKGPAVLTILIGLAGSIVTGITCGIGALVVLPIVALFMANVYKQMKGQYIAA